MAYPVSDGAVMQLSIVGNLCGQQVINTFHYVYDGPTITDGAAALASANTALLAGGKLIDEWFNTVSSDVTGIITAWQWISPLRYRMRTFSNFTTDGQEAACDIPNVAAALTLQSVEATRRGQGTKHIPGIPTGVIVDGVLDPAYVTQLADLGAAAVLPFISGAGVCTPVVYGRASNSYVKCGVTIPAKPESVLVAETYKINPYVRTMRRRTVGLGS